MTPGGRAVRLDSLVSKQLGLSRAKAAAKILAGEVSIAGTKFQKPGQTVPVGSQVEDTAGPGFVSRSAGKLAAALAEWPIQVDGAKALDVGSSTGGFTEVLLKAGARRVFAVDVGTAQLAWKLRQDPAVTVLEQTDIRDEMALRKSIAEPVDLAAVDVSFISLRSVLPAVRPFLKAGCPVVALFKPQFEAGRPLASRHQGIIKDDAIIDRLLDEFAKWAETHDWQIRERLPSPILGSKGNREQLVWLEAEESTV